MLAMILFGFLGIGAVLAVSSMIGTWLRFASSWDGLAREMRSDRPSLAGFAKVSTGDMPEARVPIQLAEFRAKPRAVRLTHDLIAAA